MAVALTFQYRISALQYFFTFVGKPVHLPDHTDYVPSVFAFKENQNCTPSKRRSLIEDREKRLLNRRRNNFCKTLQDTVSQNKGTGRLQDANINTGGVQVNKFDCVFGLSDEERDNQV